MKLTKFALSLLLISFSQLAFADNPMNSMMNTAKDMMHEGANTATGIVNSAVETAKDAADSATGVIKDAVIKTASTEDTKQFKWTQALIEDIIKGDPKKGKALAKKAKCAKCHGDTGVSDEDDTPSIAGQIAAYSFKQLYDYKMKLRDDKSMFKKVKNLSQQDMIDISAWYATQKPEAMAGDKKGKNIPVLANKGDKKRFLLACDTCHNKEAMTRGFQTPIIEGQKPEHFVDTMMAFKEGDRVNDHYKLMQDISAKLTEDEINELAVYYSVKPSKEED
jgi:cytochrome c553